MIIIKVFVPYFEVYIVYLTHAKKNLTHLLHSLSMLNVTYVRTYIDTK